MGKINVQLIASKENQDRAKCGKNEAGGMISFVCRTRKYLGNRAADDRADDAEQKKVMCTCVTDFAITPVINPTRVYQMK